MSAASGTTLAALTGAYASILGWAPASLAIVLADQSAPEEGKPARPLLVCIAKLPLLLLPVKLLLLLLLLLALDMEGLLLHDGATLLTLLDQDAF